ERRHARGLARFDTSGRIRARAMTVRASRIAGLASAIAEVRPLNEPADLLLHRFFRRHPAIGRQDRAFVADALFAWLRRRRSLEALAHTTDPAHLALAVTVREL